MEFQDVINKRKMIRSFENKPISKEKVQRLIKNYFKGPSAGFSQGIELLVLDQGNDIQDFFSTFGTPEERQRSPWKLQEQGRLVLIPLAHKQTYLDRYAEKDKGWTDKSEDRWPVPFWITDTAFASMIALLTVVNEGLGAVFVGVSNEQYVRERFYIPADYKPIGALIIGYSAPNDPPSPSLRRGHRSKKQVTHFGKFGKHFSTYDL